MLSTSKSKVSLDPPTPTHTVVRLDVPATPGHKAKDKEGGWSRQYVCV